MWYQVAILVIVAVAIGGGTFMAWRLWPQFFTDLLIVMLNAALPLAAKQMTPAQKDEWHAAERRGEGDKYMRDHLRKKLKPIFGGRNAGSG